MEVMIHDATNRLRWRILIIRVSGSNAISYGNKSILQDVGIQHHPPPYSFSPSVMVPLPPFLYLGSGTFSYALGLCFLLLFFFPPFPLQRNHASLHRYLHYDDHVRHRNLFDEIFYFPFWQCYCPARCRCCCPRMTRSHLPTMIHRLLVVGGKYSILVWGMSGLKKAWSRSAYLSSFCGQDPRYRQRLRPI